MKKQKLSQSRIKRAHASLNAKHKSDSTSSHSASHVSFPIVGIGASAGGLEAFKDLLSHLPNDTGMGIVLIQHLDPKHGSLSVEILSRSTQMPVQEAVNGKRVEPNRVYVIPPNYNLGIHEGVLKLFPRTETRGQHLPVNFFFQALARERKNQAIGVVLSGTASDGTEGLRVIKGKGGIAIAQDPKTAKYDGMPRSAIASGVVDLIRTPEGIAAELARIASNPFIHSLALAADSIKLEADESLYKIFSLLQATNKIDFSHYKRSTIRRRISRRMFLQKIEDIDKYINYLEITPEEVKELFADILIHVTEFFRDKKVFETLKSKILPKYLKSKKSNIPFRIWVPGCSTGEEAYSIAMTFIEFLDKSEGYSLGRLKGLTPFSIFATDISEQALQKARSATYPESISNEVSKERLRRFFEKTEGGEYKIAKWLRDTCLFSKHDVTRDPPFAKIDLISCRNVLIYFDQELQRMILPVFHYALNPDGILLLGKSETVGGFTNFFSLIDKTNKLYLKKNVVTPLKLQFPLGRYAPSRLESLHNISEPQPARIDIQRESDRVALLKYAPPSVVVNDALEIVQFRGRTAPYIEPSTGHASFSILRMAHPDLVREIKLAIQAAGKKNAPTAKDGLQLLVDNKIRTLNIEVVPLPVPPRSKEHYFTIFFEETDSFNSEKTKKPRVSTKKKTEKIRTSREKHDIDLQKKLFINQEYQQSLIEEYETAQEELVSANEELQSTNEELQSTNEELETAKEELQSANEELTTVNDEMQIRNAQMSSLNNDLTNLLSSVDIPIIMVGPDGKIRRFTPKAGKALKLIATDVGRPIGDIKPNIQVPDLDQLVSKVMETVNTQEMETQDEQGHWYQLQIKPYRTLDHKIDGAVIALLDIDSFKRNSEALKNAMEDLKKARDDAATIVESQPIPLLVIDPNHRVKLASNIFYEKFRVNRTETEGKPLADLGTGQWRNPQLHLLLEETLKDGKDFSNFEVEYEFPNIGKKMMLLSSKRVQLAGSFELATLLVIEDVTEQVKAERALKESEGKYRNLISNACDGILLVSDTGMIEFVNKQVEKTFGYPSQELVHQPFEILVPDRFKETSLKYRVRYFSSPVTQTLGRDLDLLGKRKDGSEFPVEISLSPENTHGATYVTATVRDISQLKEVEKKQVLLLEREKKANQIKDEFLAILSHELRTPLTTILSWAQMLRIGKLDAKKTKRGIEIVEASAKAQGQLIDDLLDISRIQAGKLNLIIQEIDPRKVIAAAIESTRNLAANKSIQVEATISPSVKTIFADPTRLQQILWNLITNSIKFSPQGGKTWVRLESVSSTFGERVSIEVCDNGKGIKPEFIPIIFDRFSQVDSSNTRVYGGLGLGLAIVKKLVEMHQGTITASSPGEGKGSTFTVSLPLKPDGKFHSAEIETEGEGEAEVRLDGIRILVVDDEANAREVFSIMLQSLGAKVKTADSVKQALLIFQEFRPDILVSDIAMPFEDGYSLIRKIRGLKSKLRDTPALALTAFAGLEDIQRIHVEGFQSHVAKPVEANKLALAIARLVGKK